MIITVESRARERNNRVAADNRARLNEARVCAVNVLSAPDAGKTSLIEGTIELLQPRVRLGVISGDTHSAFDARRLARFELPVVRLVLQDECHLDARLVERALDRFDDEVGLEALDLVMIENVDNLHCTPKVDLGEHLRVSMLSMAAGEQAPLRYPEALRVSSALIINKTDLVPFGHCDLDAMRAMALHVNPGLTVFETSCTTNQGVPEWCDWLARHIGDRRTG